MSRQQNTGESKSVNRRAVWAAVVVIAVGGAFVGADLLHAAGGARAGLGPFGDLGALGAVVPPGPSSDAAREFARATPLALARVTETDEESQPDTLPALPPGMRVADVALGDALFHGKGGCYQCHGMEATGLPKRGSSLTAGLIYVPIEGALGWAGVDSLVLNGVPEAITRSQVAMPMRGLNGDLTADETRRVAAYVWAIAQARGEPWPGGHARHATGALVMDPRTTGP